MKKLDTLQDATVVTIDPRRTLGPIRPMNAVNNGPAAPNDADFVTRYNFDNNVTWHRRVRVRLAGGAKFGKLRCHLTDFWRTYTEFPLEQADDGSVLLFMEPCSFALLEW